MSRTSQVSVSALPGRQRRAGNARVVRCQICRATTVAGLNLGSQPISDLLIAPGELNRPLTTYPLQLYHCDGCGLTQLGYIASPRVVYKNFPFVSGTTKTATQHLQSLPKRLAKMLPVTAKSFAVDIGSNDGTLLAGWLPFGNRFLGVDPAGDPVKIANDRGLTTWHAFFNEETAGRIVKKFGRAGAVTACGCFAHIADFDSLMRGIVKLLAPQGIFASDNQYWLDMVERLHYDNVFHQHLRYYAVRPLQELFRRYGLEMFDVERSEVYGGSIRVYACHAGARPMHRRVRELAALEAERRLYDPSTNAQFAKDVEQRRDNLFDTIYRLKRQNKKIIGVGAPAKAAVVCNYCRLGPDLIDYITEINPLRIGMVLPGANIPIVAEDEMFRDERPADAALLFAWNYYDEVVPKLRQRGFQGELIQP